MERRRLECGDLYAFKEEWNAVRELRTQVSNVGTPMSAISSILQTVREWFHCAHLCPCSQLADVAHPSRTASLVLLVRADILCSFRHTAGL